MISRRQFGIGVLAMAGDKLVRPLNAPAGGPLRPGVQPGATGAIVVANIVIVSGPGGGVFVFAPSAAAGNLIASLTDASTDPFGDVTEKGVTAYVTDLNSLREAVNLNASNVSGFAGLSIRDTAHPPFAPPGAYGQGSGAAPGASKAVAFLDSGLVANTDADATVSAQSQTHSGVANGLIQLLAGQVQLGNAPALTVNDNTGAVTATGGSAATPTLITTDSWHQVTPGGSWANSGSGVNGFFYQLQANGHVLLAWDVSTSSANPGTLGTLPAGYRPATTVRLQSGWSGTGPAAYNNQFNPTIQVAANGNITGAGLFVSGLNLFGTATLPIGSL